MCEALVILGPTASGKSALSLQVAQKYDAEIISLDSALIYKGMDIGTAKPTVEERAICPHHLIDICDPKDTYSAAAFRQDCIRLVEDIKARGKLPVICGGTMMYYKALVDGLSPLPETDEKVRAQVLELAEKYGWPHVHAMLETIDPVQFKKLAPNDKQRVGRAMEVYLMTGKPMSSFFSTPKDECPFSRMEVVLLPHGSDRTKLRYLIRKRFEQMLEQGLIDEVKALKECGDLNPDLPSMRSVGYRQVLEYLEGKTTYEEMVELSVIATARLAKHQMTWLRGGLKDPQESNGKVVRYSLEIEDSDKWSKLEQWLDNSTFKKFKKAQV